MKPKVHSIPVGGAALLCALLVLGCEDEQPIGSDDSAELGGSGGTLGEPGDGDDAGASGGAAATSGGAPSASGGAPSLVACDAEAPWRGRFHDATTLRHWFTATATSTTYTRLSATLSASTPPELERVELECPGRGFFVTQTKDGRWSRYEYTEPTRLCRTVTAAGGLGEALEPSGDAEATCWDGLLKEAP